VFTTHNFDIWRNYNGVTNNDLNNTMNVVVIDNLQALHQQWFHQDEGALVMHVLSFLDVKTLVQTRESARLGGNSVERRSTAIAVQMPPKLFNPNKN
jgi:hypothetical protein